MLYDTLANAAQDASKLGGKINEELKKSISSYSERIVRILSRTSQNEISVDRHDHHYKLEINRDNGRNIVRIDVIRARHRHHGAKLTFSIIQESGRWTAKSSAADPLKYTRVYKRIQRIASELERDE